MTRDEAMEIMRLTGEGPWPREQLKQCYRYAVIRNHPDTCDQPVPEYTMEEVNTAFIRLRGIGPPKTPCKTCGGKGKVAMGLTQMPCAMCGGSGEQKCQT